MFIIVDFSSREIRTCQCNPLPVALVSMGYFPTSPCKPSSAFSIDLLNFEHHLRDKSGDTVTGTAHALQNFYFQRGFTFTNTKVFGHL
jgi:hypothetical protein